MAGRPIRLAGHKQIRPYLEVAGTSSIEWREFTDVVFHESVDAEFVIVEYESNGIVRSTGASFH
jgi:hypothetical protein